MNILVTGATGFIGYHLVNKLIEQGNSVRCLVRKNSNISKLKKIKVDLWEGDLLKKNTLNGILEKVDIVYHLAGKIYCRKSREFYEGNVIVTRNLLEACIGGNIKKFVYVSSIAVYKPPLNKTLLTEDSPCGPITPYGKTKLEAEKLTMDFCAANNIPVTIVRGPVIYGPGEPIVLTNFFLKAIRKKVSIIGDGENFRSLCYIENFVDGLILVGKKSEAIGKIYNISDKKIYTFNEILKVTSEVLGEPIKTIYLPRWIGNISWLIYNILGKIFGIYFIELYGIKTMVLNLGCDISKVENELGYNPQINLKIGLEKTFDWIRKEFYE